MSTSAMMVVISASRWAGMSADQQQQKRLPLRMDALKPPRRTCEGTWRRQDELARDLRLHGRTQHDAVCAPDISPACSGSAGGSPCTLTARDQAF